MLSFKSLLSCGVATAAVFAAPHALAETRTFDVKAQPAVSAVPEFARQAQLQIIAPAGELSGVRTQAVVGEFEVRLALQRLLQGTPLSIASDTGRLITLRSTAAAKRRLSGHGALSGRILNPATGEYMPNARIRVVSADGERRETASGERGEYYLYEAPAGDVEVTVSFIGHPDTVLAARVAPDETTRLDVRLGQGAGAVDVGELIVVAARDGDARAIMSQRQSMDIINSLSAESYGDISEGNPGEFIKFMPGVDTDSVGDGTVRNVQLRGLPSAYTAVTLNGVNLAAADANDGAGASRTFSFEQMSLSGIDSIEISKTVSADVDANAPAGTVNVKTKRAFDREGRRIMLQVSGSTHSNVWDNLKRTGPGEGGYGGRKVLPSGVLEYSDVFLDGRLGVVANISKSNLYVEQEQTTLSRNYAPTAISPSPLGITVIEPQMGTREISRASAALNLDFKATDKLIVSLAAIVNESSIWAGSTAPNFTTGVRTRGLSGDPVFGFTTQQAATASTLLLENTVTYKKGEGRTLIPSFEYADGPWKLDGYASYSASTSNYDPIGEKGAVYALTAWPTSTGNFSATREPGDLYGQAWQIQQVSGPDWSQSSSFTIAGTPTIRTRNASSAEVSLGAAALNVSYDADVAGVPVTFKAGVKAQRAEYDFDNRADAYLYRYVGPLSTPQLLEAIRSTNQASYADSGIKITTLSGSQDIYLPSMYKLGEMFLTHPEDWEHTMSATNWYNANIANNRHYEEDTNAVYGMATATLTDQLTVRAGLRWEQTKSLALEPDPLSAEQVAAAGYAVSTTTGRATTIEGLQYQYQSRPKVERKGEYDNFFPSASLKYSFNDTTDLQLGYSRTIRRPEVSVLSGVWSVNDVDKIVSAPNPGLEPEISDNFSVRLVKYFEPVGMVAINYYRNQVKGLFQTQELTAAEFGYEGGEYADYTFRTTEKVSGDSISIQGYELEFSHALEYLPGPLAGLAVRGSFMVNDPEVPLVRVADKLATFSVSYKQGPARLYFNSVWTDEKYRSTTPSWFDKFWDTNLSGSYELGGGWEGFFSARNLLDRSRNVIVPGRLAADGSLGDHSAIYIHGGRNLTLGVRARF